MERTDSPQRGAPKRTQHWWHRHERGGPSPLCELEDHIIGADYYAELGFLPPVEKTEPEPVLVAERTPRSA
jgi:hypothetical protein